MTKSKPLSKLIAYAVTIAILVGSVSPAYSATYITINGTGTGTDDHWTSGSANTSRLYTTGGGNSNNYTHWVDDHLDDQLEMTGGLLITDGLYQNGALYASSGTINVQSGTLNIGSYSGIGTSYINPNVTLKLDYGSTLRQTAGNVTINSGDTINSNAIINATGGNLTFSGGTHSINSGTISNNFSITGGTVSVANAGSLQSNFSNTGTLNINGGNKTVVITGDNGTTNFHGTNTNNANITQNTVTNDGTLTNNATITAQTVTNSGTLTNTATIAAQTVTNTGTLTNNSTINANLTNSNNINGNGSIVTKTGDSLNSGSISQYNLTNNGTFTNNGQINLSNILTNNEDFTNNGQITLANKLTNNSSATFTTNASLIDAENGVLNNGTLNFTGGENDDVVTGTGRTNVKGNLDNYESISQTNINVDQGVVVTTNASLLTATDLTETGIYNRGIINYTGGTTGNKITGDGRLVITGYVTNTGDIDQSQVNNSSVFVNNGDVNANLVNTGSLEGTGDYVTKAGVSSNSGTIQQNTLTNNGTFDNNGHISLTGALTNNGTFNTNAGLLAATGGANNLGTLNLTEGTNNVAITGTGTTNFSGTTTNSATVNQNNVNNDGILTNNSTITANNFVNTNEIRGTNGSIVTTSGGVSSNEGTITQNNLTNNGTFTNNGTIDLTGTLTNNGTFDNNDMLSAIVNNTLGHILNSNADDLGGDITNNGTLNLNGDGTLLVDVDGNGTTNFDGDITNKGNIEQGTVVVSNTSTLDNEGYIEAAVTNNGTINTIADDLAGTVANEGELNIDGGTTAATYTGNGEMNIIDDLTVNHTISQGSITNYADLTNNSVITSDDVVNYGTISGAASGLEGNVDNEGTLTFNVASASAGTAVISGTGDVQVTANTTLGGTNTYTGDTLIKGATLTIAGQSNISTDSDILFANATNDSILQVTGAGTLSNLLKGQAATDNVNVQNDAALTLNAAIGEATDFHKYGNGVMTLGMTSNNYTGDTYVHAGTLIGNTGNINNTVIGDVGSTVEFTDNTDAELNKIDTDGTFVQSGSAVLNVKNNAFSAAQVELNNGTFAANRALTATTLNVNNGATLRGNGNITGTVNVNNGATIAPGNSIDTLTVTGNVNFNTGSTTAIEINETSSDKIVITGNANIQSGANLTVANEGGRFFDWENFEIINAANITGANFEYDGTIANFDASRIDVELTKSGSNVILTAKRKATDYENVEGLSDNQQQVAQSIDAVSTGYSGDITNALLQLEALSGLNPDDVTILNANSTLASALDDLSGNVYANASLTTLLNAKTAHVYNHINKENNNHNNLWLEYYGQHDNVYKTANSRGFTNNTTGALVGYDRLFENALLGAYISGGKNNLRQGSQKVDIEDFSLGLYAGYQPGNWTFKGTLLGGYQTYYGKRHIDFMESTRTAKSTYHGFNFALDLEAGYNVYSNDWFNVKPFVGVLGNYTQTRSFTETGADSLNLRVKSKNLSSAQARLGVELDGKVGQKLNWYGSAAAKRYLTDDYSKLHISLDQPGALDMQIMSAKLGHTYFSGQLGLNYAITNQWSVFGNTELGINNRTLNCNGNIGVAYSW